MQTLRQLSTFFIFIFLFTSCQDEKPKTEPVSQETGWALVPFAKVDSVNPVLTPGTGVFNDPIWKKQVSWEQKDVFNPAIVVRDNKIFMLYRAEDTVGKYAGTSRIGLAESSDGLHFIRHPEPVLFPDNDDQKKYEWEGGCEDPRVVEDESGIYHMTYTAYDGKTARLLVATSKDLVSWAKQGPAFSGKYTDIWSKSGSIVSRYVNGKIIATKINGKYWMYWGDTNIWPATSDDLIHWTPLEKIVFGPRPKKFDSDLVEPGPPAMLTDSGIILIYNSRNTHSAGDSSLPDGTYAAAQVLMDKNDPAKVLQRMDTWFMKPDKPYEISGQVNHVCFVEGLAQFNNKWFLYYGTADSKIAVAVKE
jgi:predicted GH43/DUF377 family glycosyl hydrolase